VPATSFGPDSIAATCVELGYKAGTDEYDYCFQSLTKSYASRGLSGTSKRLPSIGVDAVAPATAPPLAAHQFDGTASQPEPKTYYEREAREYSKIYKPDQSASVHNYWTHRLDIADRLDKGQISLQTANELLQVYYQQASREISDEVKAQSQQAAQAQAATQDDDRRLQLLQAISEAQAKEAAEQRRINLITEGFRMMTGANNASPPPRQQCTRWFAGQWVTYPC
jgi:hypothetical protein